MFDKLTAARSRSERTQEYILCLVLFGVRSTALTAVSFRFRLAALVGAASNRVESVADGARGADEAFSRELLQARSLSAHAARRLRSLGARQSGRKRGAASHAHERERAPTRAGAHVATRAVDAEPRRRQPPLCCDRQERPARRRTCDDTVVSTMMMMCAQVSKTTQSENDSAENVFLFFHFRTGAEWIDRLYACCC